MPPPAHRRSLLSYRCDLLRELGSQNLGLFDGGRRGQELWGFGEGNYAIQPASFVAFDAWFKEFLPRMLAATK